MKDPTTFDNNPFNGLRFQKNQEWWYLLFQTIAIITICIFILFGLHYYHKTDTFADHIKSKENNPELSSSLSASDIRTGEGTAPDLRSGNRYINSMFSGPPTFEA